MAMRMEAKSKVSKNSLWLRGHDLVDNLPDTKTGSTLSRCASRALPGLTSLVELPWAGREVPSRDGAYKMPCATVRVDDFEPIIEGSMLHVKTNFALTVVDARREKAATLQSRELIVGSRKRL